MRRSTRNSNIRKIQKTGGDATYMVTLPIRIVRQLEWQENQKVVCKKYGNGILIQDWEDTG